jgi:hypothetical protein
MIIEYQLLADRVAAILTAATARRRICLPGIFQIPDGSVTVEALVDHLELLPCSIGVESVNSNTIFNPDGSKASLEPGRIVRIKIPVVVRLVRLTDLQSNGGAPSAPFKSYTVTLLLDLRTDIFKAVPRLITKFRDIDFGLLNAALDDEAKEDIRSRIKSSFAVIVTPLDMAPLEALGNGLLAVRNFGISLDTAHNFLAMRLDLGGIDDDYLDTWTDFYKGMIGNHLMGRDWSVLVDQRIIVARIVADFEDGLTKKDEPQFELDDDKHPSGEWTSAFNTPLITVKFSGQVIDACPHYVPVMGVPVYMGMLDVDADVTATVSLKALLNPGTDRHDLQARAKVNWELNDFEVAECAIAAAIMWPVVGTILLAEGKINWGEFFGVLLVHCYAPVIVLIGGAIAASEQGLPPETVKDLLAELEGECHEVHETDEDFEVVCIQQVPQLANPLVGDMAFDTVGAIGPGLLLGGALTDPEVLTPAKLTVKVDGFEWRILGNCNTLQAGVRCQVHLGNTGQQQFALCSLGIPNPQVNDPLNFYGPYLPAVAQGTITIEIPQWAAEWQRYRITDASLAQLNAQDVPKAVRDKLVVIKDEQFFGEDEFLQALEDVLGKPDALLHKNVIFAAAAEKRFLDAPYPLKLLIVTTGGVRWIEIDPFAQSDPAALAGLQAKAIAGCQEWIDPSGDALGYNPTWDIDPESTATVMHLWEVLLSGNPGYALDFFDARGKALASVKAAPAGTMKVALLVSPASGGKEITIKSQAAGVESVERSAADGLRESREPISSDDRHPGWRLRTRRVLLTQQSMLLLPAPCLQWQFAPTDAAPLLFALTEAGLYVYDVSDPGVPRLQHRERLTGVRGGTYWSGGWLAWGSPRVGVCGARELQAGLGTLYRITTLTLPRKTVRQVVNADGHLYARTAHGIHVIDPALREIGRLPHEGLVDLAVAGKRLVALDPAGISVFSLARPSQPEPVGSYSVDCAQRLINPRPAMAHTIYVQRQNAGGVLLDLTRPSQPQAVAEYSSPPWDADALHRGDLLATLDANRRWLRFYRVGPATSGPAGHIDTRMGRPLLRKPRVRPRVT